MHNPAHRPPSPHDLDQRSNSFGLRIYYRPFTIDNLFKQLLLTLLLFANTNYFTEKHAETCTLTHPLSERGFPHAQE
jgi:hypothetical protein